MDLQEFVQESILQIARAVAGAQRIAAEERLGAIVNPLVKQTKTGGGYVGEPGSATRRAEEVAFDVALTVSESAATEKGGGAKARLHVFSGDVGGSTSKTNESSAVSRVKFAVPVAFAKGR